MDAALNRPFGWKRQPWIVLMFVSISELFALSIWFSASAVVPTIERQWNINSLYGGWLTAIVQIGFVCGALTSAYFSMADRFNSRKLFAVSAILGAIANTIFVFSPGFTWGLVWRFATGVSLAGVYPVAVKIISLWFPRKRGLAIGILIGALTLGSASPHFILIFMYGLNWKFVVSISSVLSVAAAMITLLLVPDRYGDRVDIRGFSIEQLRKVVRNKPVMLANFGYFGHMWELYAMWTWFPFFFQSSIRNVVYPPSLNFVDTTCSFLVIGVAGILGSIFGGWFADRYGRTLSTSISMAISGACSVIVGFTFHQSLWSTFVIGLIWGTAVIADSAQFSTAVTEISDSSYVGTALTFQMAGGFLITAISMNVLPIFVKYIGWHWAFSILVIGPVFGMWSMLKLRRTPESIQLAHGKR